MAERDTDLRKVGGAIQFTIGAIVILVVAVAGLAGALTHPLGAVVFLLLVAGVFGVAYLQAKARSARN